MFKYKVLENGVEINVIVADEVFANKYATATGYALELIPEEPISPEPSTETDLMNLTIDHEYRLALLELGV